MQPVFGSKISGSRMQIKFTLRIRSSSRNQIYEPNNLDQRRARPVKLAPAVGFEPTTNRLTADRSTTELRWINNLYLEIYNYSAGDENIYCHCLMILYVLSHVLKWNLDKD